MCHHVDNLKIISITKNYDRQIGTKLTKGCNISQYLIYREQLYSLVRIANLCKKKLFEGDGDSVSGQLTTDFNRNGVDKS